MVWNNKQLLRPCLSRVLSQLLQFFRQHEWVNIDMKLKNNVLSDVFQDQSSSSCHFLTTRVTWLCNKLCQAMSFKVNLLVHAFSWQFEQVNIVTNSVLSNVFLDKSSCSWTFLIAWTSLDGNNVQLASSDILI